MLDVLLDSLLDSLKLLPFLLLTYLLMEWVEHKGEQSLRRTITNVNKLGPLLGGLFGVIPQCGFSAGCASLYSARVISLGTLIAIFLSTSDEMLPIMVASAMTPGQIVKILLIKVVIAVISGYIIEVIIHYAFKKKDDAPDVHIVCEEEHCNCKDGIWISAIKHTVTVFIYIFIFTLIINIIVFYVGEDKLTALFSSVPVVGQLIAALVGLIPNCASSVIITELYLEGIISGGIMMSGLLVNAGVGMLVLFRQNRILKQNLTIIGILYALGVFWGMVIELTHLL